MAPESLNLLTLAALLKEVSLDKGTQPRKIGGKCANPAPEPKERSRTSLESLAGKAQGHHLSSCIA